MPGEEPTFASLVARIRDSHHLPAAFSAEVDAAAHEAAGSQHWREGRVDLTEVALATLDPAASVDLDQAFALTSEGDDLVLHYAIADIATFAPIGGPVELEAWERGVTVYLPDGRVPLYPTVLSEHAASLLPEGERPAIMLEVVVARDATSTLRNARRAIVRSRAKLAYESTEPADLDPLVRELHARMQAAELRRGATKVDWPAQEIELDPTRPGGVNLVLRPMRPSEEVNASLSLAANLAVAGLMLEHRSGLFRVMPEPDLYRQKSLRKMARALGIDWPDDLALRDLMPRLHADDPRHKRLLVEARRAGRGASYAVFDPDVPPWHAALAAVYAHATAPMRRLADRYVLEHVLALVAGRASDPTTTAALPRLPAAMAKADARAASVDRAVVDTVEALELHGQEGRTFAATAIEVSRDGVVVQLAEPPVRARVKDAPPDLAEDAAVTVRLLSVDVGAGAVRFEILPS